MTSIDVIIGLNYGDEGKGLATDYFSHSAVCSGKKVAVVRFNSGAQAGHTVELESGVRHVFHHFGSGTFNGVPTILSKHFIVNPALFFDEVYKIVDKSGQRIPLIHVDPDALVTTPYDVFINQALERSRGDARHGSCGIGFGETIERRERGFPLYVKDIMSSDFGRLVREIENSYFHQRLDELGLSFVDTSILDDTRRLFMADAIQFAKSVDICYDTTSIAEYDHLVFEGAQGLCLDENSKDFPHVTRSSTGLENVADLISHLDHPRINVRYITRTYITRHGAGSLNNEMSEMPSMIDKTNMPNEFQGSMRFAPLDYKRIRHNVARDLKFLEGRDHNVSAFITCCDQADKHQVNGIKDKVSDSVGTDTVYTSWGPTRGHIKVDIVIKVC